MDWNTLVLALGTALCGIGSFFLWLETRGDRGSKKRAEREARMLAPVVSDLKHLHEKFDLLPAQRAVELKIALSDAMEPVKDEIRVMATKIEPLWHALEQLAIDNARLLHKPHPENAEFDALLDKFIASQDGEYEMTAEEDRNLRQFLMRVRDWRGNDIGIVVEEGDPTRAAILLRTMGLSRIRSRQERR